MNPYCTPYTKREREDAAVILSICYASYVVPGEGDTFEDAAAAIGASAVSIELADLAADVAGSTCYPHWPVAEAMIRCGWCPEHSELGAP